MKTVLISSLLSSFILFNQSLFAASYDIDKTVLEIPVLQVNDGSGANFFQLKMTLLTTIDNVYAFSLTEFNLLEKAGTNSIDQFNISTNKLDLPSLSIIDKNQVSGAINVQLNLDLLFDGVVTLSINNIKTP